MSDRNSGQPSVVVSRKRWRKRANPWSIGLPLAALVVMLGMISGLIPLPRDAGPTEIETTPLVTVIDKVDFQCNAGIKSVSLMTAWNPGWEWGWLNGGQAFVAFDVVSDLDLCVWANDYEVELDKANDSLVVTVARVDARRPRIDHNPWNFNGTVYQTFELSSQGRDSLAADANLDRVIWEAARNLIRGNDENYLTTMTIQLSRFAANELLNTSCLDEALAVVEEGLLEHFHDEAFRHGVPNVVLTMPSSIDIPDLPDLLETEDTELNRHGDEECIEQVWEAQADA